MQYLQFLVALLHHKVALLHHKAVVKDIGSKVHNLVTVNRLSTILMKHLHQYQHKDHSTELHVLFIYQEHYILYSGRRGLVDSCELY